MVVSTVTRLQLMLAPLDGGRVTLGTRAAVVAQQAVEAAVLAWRRTTAMTSRTLRRMTRRSMLTTGDAGVEARLLGEAVRRLQMAGAAPSVAASARQTPPVMQLACVRLSTTMAMMRMLVMIGGSSEVVAGDRCSERGRLTTASTAITTMLRSPPACWTGRWRKPCTKPCTARQRHHPS